MGSLIDESLRLMIDHHETPEYTSRKVYIYLTVCAIIGDTLTVDLNNGKAT